VTITLGLDGSGKVDIVAGGYEHWAKRRHSPRPFRGGLDSAKPSGGGAVQGNSSSAAPTPKPPLQGRGKLSYKDQRDLDRLPEEVARIDGEIAALEEALHDPDLYTRDPKRFAELTDRAARLRADKDAAEERWLEVAEMAESLSR
jgi:ATP-binding cassette subfamily F protein uup